MKDMIYEGDAWIRVLIREAKSKGERLPHLELTLTIRPDLSKGKCAWGMVR